MFKFLAWIHGLLLRLVLWALMVPLKAFWATLLAVLALLSEETRRWFGLAVMGLLIFLAGKAVLNFAPDQFKMQLALTILALVCIWGLAVLRSVRFTMRNNLVRVRQRQAFRDLQAEVTGTRRDVTEGLARATRNTPIRRAFRSNREDIAKAEEQARQAEAEAEKQAAREAYLESLPPDHDPFATQGSR